MTYIYVCVNRNCHWKGVEVHANLGPRDARLATGRAVCCQKCNDVLVLRRVETPTDKLIQDEIARGAGPGIRTNQVLREVRDAEEQEIRETQEKP